MIKSTIKYGIILVVVVLFGYTSCSSANEDVGIEVEEEVVPIPVKDVTIVWENWYLSVPVDRGGGSATSIKYEAIVNNSLTPEQSKYFYRSTDGSYSMYTKFTGFTTSGGPFDLDGGKYCRTELREFWQGNQTTSDNWSMSEGTHILESTIEVEYCEGTGQTYIAQIHGIETDAVSGSPATVKVQWKNGDIVIEYYVKPDVGKEWTSEFDEKITIAKVDNEIFTIKIKIHNGKLYYGIICEAKNLDTDYTFVFDYIGNGYLHDNYFKTGNYFKWNKDYEQSSKVILYKVVTSHT